MDTLIAPALARSRAVRRIEIDRGAVAAVGAVAADVSERRRAVIFADAAGLFDRAVGAVVAEMSGGPG